MSEKNIYVYADWLELPELMGVLHIVNSNGRERCSFEYDSSWLEMHSEMVVDPDICPCPDRQYPMDGKAMFGVFLDSCPDRWGRLLMRRHETMNAETEGRKPAKLLESDYLLGVCDETRMGAIHFALEPGGEFQLSDRRQAAPPWENLRQLESASLAFENGRKSDEGKWLRQLLAPGSSLGGTRPKVNVKAPDGSLWIAKFPSKYDEWDVGAWEMVAHDLASLCGLNVPAAKLLHFSDAGSTFLVKRFDRDGVRRIPFASAMTMLGYTDDAEEVSYLEIAEFVKKTCGKDTRTADLYELWSRIVFGIAVSNIDDHLRNHGFLYEGGRWHLSPLYDVNPNVYGDFLALNIDLIDASLDFELALSVANEFGVADSDAIHRITSIAEIVDSNWEVVAKKYGIPCEHIERMRSAFLVSHEYISGFSVRIGERSC